MYNRRNHKRCLLSLITLTAGMLFASCNMFFPENPIKETEKTVKISLSVDDSAARTIGYTLPSIEGYTLTGTESGGTSVNLGNWTKVEMEQGVEIDLALGSWTFILEAKDIESTTVLRASIEDKVISGPDTLTFNLSPLETGFGTVDVTLMWPTNTPVTHVETKLDGTAYTPALTIVTDTGAGSCSLHFYDEAISTGDKVLIFRLLDEDGDLVASVTERLRVRGNLTSSETITLQAGDLSSPPEAPTDFTATVLTNIADSNTVDVQFAWTDNAHNETGYRVEYSTDGGTSWNLSGESSATQINLQSTAARGPAIVFRIRAFNNYGYSTPVESEAFNIPWLLSFDTGAGSPVDAQEVLNGQTANPPANPLLADYGIGGWFTEASYSQRWDFTTDTLTESQHLYAQWLPASGITITIQTPDVDDPVADLYSIITAGENLAISVFDNYTDYQWYLDGDLLPGKTEASWSLDTSATGYNLSVGAHELAFFATDAAGLKYSGRNYFTVTTEIPLILHGNGGTDSSGRTQYRQFHADGSTIPLETCPFTRDGYVFIGWSHALTGPTEYAQNASCSPAEGETLYARWLSATAAPSEDFLSIQVEEEITLRRYTGSDTQVEIPRMILKNGLYYPVTAFISAPTPAAGVFANNINIIEIHIPKEINDLGDYAFFGCLALDRITLEEGNENYMSEDGVLFNKDKTELILYPSGKLTENYTIPDSVELIKESAIEQNNYLITITSNGNLQTIEPYAFCCSTSLTTINLPNSVSTIGEGTFDYCPALTSITIPTSTTMIDNYTFAGCSSLTSVTLHEGITSIGQYAFADCTSLESIIIPAATTVINDSTFSGCSALTSVTLHDEITSIGQQAFKDCTSLESIIIPAATTFINDKTFSGCSTLTSVTMHEGITALGEQSFAGCSALESISLPDSIETIGPFAFLSCTALGSFNIPTSVKTIRNNAFCNCGPISAITLPATLTTFGDYVFASCKQLTSIDVADENTALSSLDGVLFNKAQTTLVLYPPGRAVESYSVPLSVTTITCMGGCAALKALTLPASISNIGMAAFSSNIALASITINAETPPALEGSTFYNTPAEMTIHVPTDSVAAYQAAAGWSDYSAQISAIE